MLLAAYDARRATADADALARHMTNDEDTVAARVVEVARVSLDDGVTFLPDTLTTRVIRGEALYAGLRVTMDARIATATVKLRLDVNFGDPVTPAPQQINLPPLRSDTPPIHILGYPLETVLAEKIATAIFLGAANSRVRDYADLYTLTGRHDVTHAAASNALRATAEFRGIRLTRLSSTIDNLVELRDRTYAAYRTRLGVDGDHLPERFTDVVAAVTTFADPLVEDVEETRLWEATQRRWTTPQED